MAGGFGLKSIDLRDSRKKSPLFLPNRSANPLSSTRVRSVRRLTQYPIPVPLPRIEVGIRLFEPSERMLGDGQIRRSGEFNVERR